MADRCGQTLSSVESIISIPPSIQDLLLERNHNPNCRATTYCLLQSHYASVAAMWLPHSSCAGRALNLFQAFSRTSSSSSQPER